ncbi:META domain-containing protein [Streptomyces sp. NPDC001617]
MDKQRLTLAVLTVVPLAMACAGPDADVTPLLGTKWTVTSPNAGKQAYLTFDAKTHKVGGRLGCNYVNATATVRSGHITLGRPLTTRMMCDASLMKTERTLLGLFGHTVGYRVDHDTLTLTRENGPTVRASAAK